MKFDYDAHARTCAPKDFWGQVRRTVQGVPVSDDQIGMIVETIHSALELTSDDVILDLACGNGALTKHLFSSCSGCTGVDVSEHLIAIAKANFEMLPHYSFEQHGAGAYVDAEYQPTRYTKALCYGSFQYFSEDEASAVLRTLFEKFSRTQRVFIGNLPDKARAEIFYKREPDIDELNNFHSPIGCWRTQQEFAQLARTAGWQVTFSAMPPAFYAASYRYDALLSRA